MHELIQHNQHAIVPTTTLNAPIDALNMVVSSASANANADNRIGDKLSFTKFEIGDIALFLPLA